jgi:hypothetical protein
MMTAKTVKLDQGRTSSALFSYHAVSHQDTKTLSFIKGFIKNKSLVPWCLSGISKESKNARIKRYYQKVQ